jgi:hypothetical protein
VTRIQKWRTLRCFHSFALVSWGTRYRRAYLLIDLPSNPPPQSRSALHPTAPPPSMPRRWPQCRIGCRPCWNGRTDAPDTPGDRPAHSRQSDRSDRFFSTIERLSGKVSCLN